MTRARHEASIRRMEHAGESFDKALSDVVYANGLDRRFEFFTDDQIAAIRAMMVVKALDERNYWRKVKERRAAIRAMCETGAG
jgi:hypothetical protein